MLFIVRANSWTQNPDARLAGGVLIGEIVERRCV